MRRRLVSAILSVAAKLAAFAEWLKQPEPVPQDSWWGWTRHFADGRNHWEVICRRPSPESAWTCLGRYAEQYPEGTSTLVLPAGMVPEIPVAEPVDDCDCGDCPS